MHGLQGNLKPRNEFADTESFRIALLSGIVEYVSRDEAPAVVAGHNGSWANTVCAITRFCDAVRDAMWQFVDAFLFADFFQDEEKPEPKLHKFAPCSWRMVFEEKIE